MWLGLGAGIEGVGGVGVEEGCTRLVSRLSVGGVTANFA